MKKVIFYPSALPWRQSFAILLFMMLFRELSFGQLPSVFCTPHQTSFLANSTATLPFWASDFFEFGISPNGFNDNSVRLRIINPSGTIVAGGASGYPTPPPPGGYQLTCDNGGAGIYTVHVWGQDNLGNADYCTTQLLVNDNSLTCPSTQNPIFYTGKAINQSSSSNVQDVTFYITGDSPITGPFAFNQYSEIGEYDLSGLPSSSFNIKITASKNLPVATTQGISVYDIVLIQKHILGFTPLPSPYRMISADVNNTNSITGSDITEIRKFMLGVTMQLPHPHQWGFLAESYIFTNPNNPFSMPFSNTPGCVSIPILLENTTEKNFIGFKYGDTSGDALFTNDVVEDRNLPTVYVHADDRNVQAGEEFEVTFQTAEAFTAYQFTMDLQGLEVMEILPGEGMNREDFAVLDATKTITAVIANESARAFTIRFKATQSGYLSDMIHATNDITPSLAFDEVGKESKITFRFGGETAHALELYPCSPNPFTESTNIRFHLVEAAQVTLRVHDAFGRDLYTQTAQYTKGQHTIVLAGEQLQASGVLYYSLETENDKRIGNLIKM